MALHRFVRRALAALVTVTVLVPVPPAAAATDSRTSFEPTSTKSGARNFFLYSVKPGTTITDSAVLRNLTSQPQTYTLYPADAGDVNGAFAIAGQATRPTGVGSWVDLNVRRLVLGPHSDRTIQVSIRVPPNATPGDHAGGVVALALGTTPVSGRSLQVQAHYGVGIRMYFQVKGPRLPRVALTDLSLSPSGGLLGSLIGRDTARVSYRVSNAGNVRLNPTAGAVVSTFGKEVRVPGRSLGELLPGSSADSRLDAGGLRWTSLLGVMRARVTVLGGPGVPPAEAEVTALTVPWLLITVLVGATSGLWIWRRRRRRGRGAPMTPGSLPAVPSVGHQGTDVEASST